MRSLAVFGPGADADLPTITLEGARVSCALVETDQPAFDPHSPAHARKVLVRKRGFSVNYRDRALILNVALRGPAGSFYPIGSDFVADIIASGSEVQTLAPGDRVIGNAAYPDSGVPGVPAGVPVNSASREDQILHEAKLVKIPEAMADEVAACFTIGAQTSFSMVRKLSLQAGDRVLVTAGVSNTSLFAIQALRRLPVQVYVATTSPRHVARLESLGVAGVILLERGQASFATDAIVQQVLNSHGGFDAVVDPFFDLYLAPSTEVMRPGGRYVTCGLYDQHTHLGVGTPARIPNGGAVMQRLMMKNLQIIGNCIGLDGDLRAAIEAHAAGQFPVTIDSVFTGTDAAGFLNRSYNAPERFGKVAFLYR